SRDAAGDAVTSGSSARKNVMSDAEMWTTSFFLVATPLRPMATPSICITARRIRALPWQPAAFAEFSIGFTKADKESAKNLTTALCPFLTVDHAFDRRQCFI